MKVRLFSFEITFILAINEKWLFVRITHTLEKQWLYLKVQAYFLPSTLIIIHLNKIIIN